MKYLMIIFIILVAIVVISGHVLLYYSTTHFAHIQNSVARKVLAVALSLLSISFIATSLLVYWQDNMIANFLYAVASSWLGALWYFALAIAATTLVWSGLRLAGYQGTMRWIYLGFLIIAFATSIGGIVNAHRPIVRKISVHLPNLPASWKGKIIVQASDIHLGPINRVAFAKHIARQFQEIQPDCIVITGDLFDGGGVELAHLVDPLDEFQPKHGIFFITGNHETYVGLEKSLNALKGSHLRILNNEVVDLDGVQLIGMSYPLPGEKYDKLPLPAFDSTKPSILLFHEPKFTEQAKAAGINLQLAGHTHDGQLWPFGWIARAVYGVSSIGLHVEDGYAMYTSTGAGTWGPPMRVGNRPEIVAITLE